MTAPVTRSERAAQDRAAIFAITCWRIVADSFLEWLRGGPIFTCEVIARIAALARDEFSDIRREVISEIRPADE
jgi:hypothetical protein